MHHRLAWAGLQPGTDDDDEDGVEDGVQPGVDDEGEEQGDEDAEGGVYRSGEDEGDSQGDDAGDSKCAKVVTRRRQEFAEGQHQRVGVAV